MLRANKVILVSHCVLNQNSVVHPLARAKGAFDEITKMIAEMGFGIVQLPCPETLFLGLERSPMSKEEYATPEYITLCHQLAQREVEYLNLLQQGKVSIAGIVGIDQSPTCCQYNEVGHFMMAMQQYDEINGVPKIDMSELYGESVEATEGFNEKFKLWLENL
ncbi:CD3072 family TudS-related putative desulfidase [Fusibacter bizertensis]